MLIGSLKPFQESATEKILTVLKSSTACLLQGGTGVGKTFIAGEVVTRIGDIIKQHPYYPISRYPFVYVTAASVVQQTQEELRCYFGLTERDIYVISYSSIIAREGSIFWQKVYPKDYDPKDEECVARMGKIAAEFQWFPAIGPLFVILDESQRARKETSATHRCIKALIRQNPDVKVLLMSATAFTTVMESEIFARAANLKSTARATEKFFQWCCNITAPAHPCDYSEVGMRKFLKIAEPYIVRIPHINTKYKNHLKILLIDFLKEEDRIHYDKAFTDYVKECAQLRKSTAFGQKTKLVAMNKFRQRAELIRAEWYAENMYKEVNEYNHTAVCACEYQTTIVKAVLALLKRGVKRDDISIIWGGGERYTSLSKVYTQEEIYTLFTKALASPEDITDAERDDIDEIHKQITQVSMGIVEELQDKSLRLGPQSDDERELEKMKFNAGKTKYCFFTFKAGSVGLSLHHCVDYFVKRPDKYKPATGTKPEDMDWRYLDDSPVPYKPLPRRVFVSPTWNPVEWIQSIGRSHRLTSLSDTVQCGVYYRGTIEEKVADILAAKLKSIATLVKAKESWMDAIEERELQEILANNQSSVGDNIKLLAETETDDIIELEDDETD